MELLSVALAVACLAVGLLHLARCALRRRDRVGELSHAVMGLGMAAMFAPAVDPVPVPVWTLAFALCGAWFGAHALRTRTLGGDAGHHVVGSGAMIFMLAGGHSHAPGTDGSEHAGHLGHATGGGPGIASLVAIVLAGYFAWHVLRCSDRLRAATTQQPGARVGSPPPRGAGPRRPAAVLARVPALPLLSSRTAALAHIVMAVAMTVMLLAVV